MKKIIIIERLNGKAIKGGTEEKVLAAIPEGFKGTLIKVAKVTSSGTMDVLGLQVSFKENEPFYDKFIGIRNKLTSENDLLVTFPAYGTEEERFPYNTTGFPGTAFVSQKLKALKIGDVHPRTLADYRNPSIHAYLVKREGQRDKVMLLVRT